MRRWWLIYFLMVMWMPLGAAAGLRDLSLVVIDLKYSRQGGAKVCEVQCGNLSVFKSDGYCNSDGRAIVENFLRLAAGLLEGDLLMADDLCDPTMRQQGVHYGWRLVDAAALAPCRRGGALAGGSPLSLKGGGGALLAPLRRPDEAVCLGRALPGYLVVDGAMAPHLADKLAVERLLAALPSWRGLRPRCAVYPTRYRSGLAEAILGAVQSDVVVLKPPDSTKGQGVLIVHRDQLDATLRYIFTADAQQLGQHRDLSYAFWGLRRPAYFMAEAFCPSDAVAPPLMKGALFDPTLRVAAALVAKDGAIAVHFLGKYWKFPLKNMAYRGALNASHKSNGDHPYRCAVDDKTWDAVQEALREPLVELYRYVLDRSEALRQRP